MTNAQARRLLECVTHRDGIKPLHKEDEELVDNLCHIIRALHYSLTGRGYAVEQIEIELNRYIAK